MTTYDGLRLLCLQHHGVGSVYLVSVDRNGHHMFIVHCFIEDNLYMAPLGVYHRVGREIFGRNFLRSGMDDYGNTVQLYLILVVSKFHD